MNSNELLTLEHSPDDIWKVLLNVLNCVITMVSLSHTSKTIKRRVVRFAISNKISWSLKCSDIATKGYLNVLKWARELGCQWNPDTCANAALHGHLEVLSWAIKNGCRRGSRICPNASQNGHFHILEWAHKNHYFNSITFEGCFFVAANAGRLDILIWLKEHGGELNHCVCSCAARHGHLHILKWAREHNCDWNEDVCFDAAEHGHLDVLGWAYENGCPWPNYIMCACASRSNKLEILQWVRSKGCQWDEETSINIIENKISKCYNGLDLMAVIGMRTWRI